MTKTRNAECCCGRERISFSGDPDKHAACHCENCRKRTGSAFGISAYFRKSTLVQKTETARRYEVHVRDQHQTRFFCGNCGTTLYWVVSTLPDHIGVAGGCFADEPLGPPNASVNDHNQYDWVQLVGVQSAESS